MMINVKSKKVKINKRYKMTFSMRLHHLYAFDSLIKKIIFIPKIQTSNKKCFLN